MSKNDGKTTLCYMVGSIGYDEETDYSGWWSYDDPKDDEPEETWDFHYEQVDKRTIGTTGRRQSRSGALSITKTASPTTNSCSISSLR